MVVLNAEIMPGWYYEKKDLGNTPSLKDGIDMTTEKRYRREGSRFIIDVGADLSLRYDTVATGCVYFHRFFMFHSFKEFNKHVTALGCLFLAGKVEETPKKCKDLLRVARLRLTDEQFIYFGDDPKEELMVIERVLLQTIKFDLQVEHPYQFLLKYAKSLKVMNDKADIEKLVQMAWTFINDSLCTTICLEYEPEIVAIALMYLASRLTSVEIKDWTGRKNVDQEKWWDQFVEDLTLDLLEDICHQVLDLYSPAHGGGGANASVVDKFNSSKSAMISTAKPPSGGSKVSPGSLLAAVVSATPTIGHQPSLLSKVQPLVPPSAPQAPPIAAAVIAPHVYATAGGGPYAFPVIPPNRQPAPPTYAYPIPAMPSLNTPPPYAPHGGHFQQFCPQPPPPPPPPSRGNFGAPPPPQMYNMPPPGPRPMRDYDYDYDYGVPRMSAGVPPPPPPQHSQNIYQPQRMMRHHSRERQHPYNNNNRY